MTFIKTHQSIRQQAYKYNDNKLDLKLIFIQMQHVFITHTITKA